MTLSPTAPRSPTFQRAFLVALLATGLGTLAYVGCSKQGADNAADPAKTAPVATVPAPTPEMDPAQLFLGKDSPAAEKVFTLPVLPFDRLDEGLPTSGTWIGYPLLFDFSGDGRADIVCSNREEDGYNAWQAPVKGAWIRRIDGPITGDGAPPVGLPRDMQYGPAAAADCNADGIPDLVLAAHSEALRIFTNDGKMGWTRSTAPIENPNLILDIATGNLNGDAFPDVVGVGHFEGGLGVYLGDGQGGLRRLKESGRLMPAKSSFGKNIDVVDVNGDGVDDVVVTTNKGLKVFLIKSVEPFEFEEVSDGLPHPKIGNSLFGLAVGRFRAGGWLQIAVCSIPDPSPKREEPDAIGVYAWNAEAHTWEHIDQGLGRVEPYRDLAAGDLDKDGNLDLVLNSIDNGAVIALGDGKGGFRSVGRLDGQRGKARSALGDVDADGWLDILVSVPATKEHPETGGLHCFRNKPDVWKNLAK